MAALLQPLTALTTWPETVLYYTALFMLASFGAVAATSQQRLAPSPAWRRMVGVMLTIGLLYLLSVGLQLVRGWGGVEVMWLTPVWERALEAVGLIGLVWALALPTTRWATGLSLGLLGLWAVATGWSWWVWQATLAQGGTVFYNGLPADGLWALAQSALAAVGACGVLVRRPTHWPLMFSVFAVLWAGQTTHYLFPPAALHWPLAVLLSELVALALLAVLLTRQSVGTPLETPDPRPLPMLPRPDEAAPTAEALHPRLHRLANALTRVQAQKAQVEEQLYGKQVIIAQLKAELVHATAELERLQNTVAATAPEPLLPAQAPAVVALQDDLQLLRQQLAAVPPLAPSQPARQAPNLAPTPLAAACVHLGLAQDAETHNAFAAAAHRCYALATPGKIFSLQQEQFCLQAAHTQCPVFQKRVTQPTEPLDFTNTSARRTLSPDTRSRLRAWVERQSEQA